MTFQIGYLWFYFLHGLVLFLSDLSISLLGLIPPPLTLDNCTASQSFLKAQLWQRHPPSLSSCLLSVAGPQPCVSGLPKLHFPIFSSILNFSIRILIPVLHYPQFQLSFPVAVNSKLHLLLQTVSCHFFFRRPLFPSRQFVIFSVLFPRDDTACIPACVTSHILVSLLWGVTRQEVLISFCILQCWRLGLAGKVLALMTSVAALLTPASLLTFFMRKWQQFLIRTS